MCRLAAFPPGTTADLAHEIINNFVGYNDDGVGSCYLKGKSFVINKYPYGYKELMSKKLPLFDHMPYNGWTIAHVRLATQGAHTYQNTHPFIRGNVAVAHNGCFGQSEIVRAALNKSVKWQGETDSEVGAYIYSQIGAKEFHKKCFSGIWLGLHRDGSLSTAKISGDLEIYGMANGTALLASEFPRGMSYESKYVPSGAWTFDAEGNSIDLTTPKYREATPSKSKTFHWENGRYVPDDIWYPKGAWDNKGSGTTSNIDSAVRSAAQRGSVTTYPIPVASDNKVEFWEWCIEEDDKLEYLRNTT